MKTKTFKSFLSDYVKDMNPEHSLSLFKNERHIEKDERLSNVYSFYVFFNDEAVKTLVSKKDRLPRLYKRYCEYKKKYDNTSLENLKTKVEALDPFDELRQLYVSYKNLVVNRNLVLKKLYHEKITRLQREKKISTYRIYKDVNLNHGNTNDFLKNKVFNKLSIKNVKAIMDYVVSA